MSVKIKTLTWYAFLVWAVIELAISVGNFKSSAWPALPSWLDFIFFALAAANILLLAAEHVGRRKAWLSFFIVTVLSGAACYFGRDFVNLSYTPLMGPMIVGSVPLALPLLWWTVVGGFYLVYRYVLPVFDARVLALMISVSVLVFDWILEPFAWRIKFYWLWNHGTVPWQNYFVWLLLSFVLARLVPLKGDSSPAGYQKPIIVISVMLAVFILTRLAQML
ncbi:MAG: carotenoid biosynthesis protein [Verrucomicrobiales bacterium]|jgi:uncharacterized membrane protein|nr:carotenoid biosynthesis protein [Verrucomicrobiales bacterium]